MAFKPPLSKDALRDIQDRNPDSADVRALLWEVKRLRALVLRSHDYFRQTATSTTAMMLADAMRRDLADEPVIREQPRLSD